jgi:hypothetical protein
MCVKKLLHDGYYCLNFFLNDRVLLIYVKLTLTLVTRSKSHDLIFKIPR